MSRGTDEKERARLRRDWIERLRIVEVSAYQSKMVECYGCRREFKQTHNTKVQLCPHCLEITFSEVTR